METLRTESPIFRLPSKDSPKLGQVAFISAHNDAAPVAAAEKSNIADLKSIGFKKCRDILIASPSY